MNNPRPASTGLSVQQVLLCGALIVTLSMGIRHGFGFWLQPVITERGWTRETFSFAMAIQNLAWGIAGPIAGMLADRFGAWKVLIGGGLAYALGLVLMAVTSHPLSFTLGAGVLIGVAQSGSTYAVIYGVLGRTVSPEKRSWAFGVAAAAGSFGQFVMIPVETWLISHLGWQGALWLLAGAALLIVPLALGVRERNVAAFGGVHQSIGQALREAFGYRSFQLLMLGYFVCGFQVVFIGVHLPSYLKDHGLGIGVSTGALMLIGLFNIFGTYTAGMLGQRFPKRYLLSAIYGLRAVAIVIFISVPLTPLSVYVFAAVIGFLWLSTVPPTNAVVAQIFGAQHLSMLGGFVFLSHQVGSFLGVWLGGKLYDATGNYDIVWWLSIALGIMAMLANLPVRETPIARVQPA
ncbi:MULTISPECIES: MFS transporter [unclassified Roseateles]|uniref:MFS transporter n=1 Tax=unclassified Roseateles TaxID=2626991 RepID=UPI0006FE06DD|nr:MULTISPECIES: MFS transporter [unclassified Roseateles]KQW41248.1 MFS transporter [Pelomonas sp. Root405]KRA68019.1 MFS transporter [Pelomonas sp. Root662]